jgi:hypothetical protein
MSLPKASLGLSAAAMALVLSQINAHAQQTLPTIDVGGQRHSTARGAATNRNSSARAGASGQVQPSAGQSGGGGGGGSTGPAAAKPLPENNTTYRPENAVSALKTNTL